MRSATALLIAQAEHRLDQLTKPLFGRDVVEELIKEIKLLGRGDKPPLVAREIADCHNEIDCLTEELQELRAALEEAREDREQAYALQVGADSLNQELTRQLNRAKAELRRIGHPRYAGIQEPRLSLNAVPDWARDDRVEGMPGLRTVVLNPVPKRLTELAERICREADRAVG